MDGSTITVKVEDLSPVKKKLLFDISWANVKKELDSVYNDLGKKVKIKGFRPGKVPRKILETYHKDYAEEEAITNLVNRYYWNAIKEKGIDTVSKPAIDQSGIESEKTFSFSATVEVAPVIEPRDYLGLNLEKVIKKVTEEDVNSKLKQIQMMFATLEDISDDRECMNGDFVIIDFVGTIDNEKIKEMTNSNYLIEIGSGGFIPAFENQITGMKKNESKNITVKFPEGYPFKKVAGKEVCFFVTLKNIKGKKLPELDENFVKNFEKYESLDDLKKDIEKTLEAEFKAKADSDLRETIVKLLLEKNNFEVPDSLIDRQAFYLKADTRARLASRGWPKKEIDEFIMDNKQNFQEQALRSVRTALLIKSIAKRESINVTDEEITSKIEEINKATGKSYESMNDSLKEEIMERLNTDLINSKVLDFIEKNANVKLVTTDIKANGG